MIVITKCKDGTFIVSNGRKMMVVNTKAELIATVYWNYMIKPDKVSYAIIQLERKEHDLVELDYFGFIQSTRKVNYDEMFDDDLYDDE
jgi:hypothetical protein